MQAQDGERIPEHAGGSEWVSMREAAGILGPTGIDRETTRRLLAAGLAGEGVRLKHSVLYRRDRVEALAARPEIPHGGQPGWPHPGPTESLLPEICHAGTFVVRLPTRAPVDPGSWMQTCAGPWQISAYGRVRLQVMVETRGLVPLLATLGGFVVMGADITAVKPCLSARGAIFTRVELAEPGEWFDQCQGLRFRPHRGQPWWMWPDGLWPWRSAQRFGNVWAEN